MQFQTLDIPYYLGIAKDVLTLVATSIAAYVALNGLHTWKRQLRGQSEYDLAKRILQNVYETRESLMKFRSILIGRLEIIEALKKSGCEINDEALRSNEEYQKSVNQNVMFNRFNLVEEKRIQLFPLLVEGELYWDQKINAVFKNYFKCLNQISNALFLYYFEEHFDEPIDPEKHAQQKRIIFSFNDDEDEFWIEFKKSIEEIDKFLKKFLRIN